MTALEKEIGEKIAGKLVNTIFQALQSF